MVSRRAAAGVTLGLIISAGAATGVVVGWRHVATAQRAEVRLNQVGYVRGAPKVAVLLAGRDAAGTDFRVVDASGAAVLSGTIGANEGGWSDAYPAVHPIDLSTVDSAGDYRIVVDVAGGVRSPTFRVASAADLYRPVAADLVGFFRTQRDGLDLAAAEPVRRPAHAADAAATVFRPPDGDGDEVTGPLERLGGPVDVSGGWFDAGDYLKFTATASYALVNMMMVVRAEGAAAVPGLAAEAEHGLAWLERMWDGSTGVLYAQVGIGTAGGGTVGDHDLWRLPESDDARAPAPGDPAYLLTYRPVLPANRAGEPVSPNLAGRVAAAFALAAQVHAGADAGRARADLDRAASVYAHAGTGGGGLVSTFPHAYYPEESWADDLELGAAELARAAHALGDPRGTRWATDAAAWADRNLAGTGGEPPTVYDVDALAHLELATLARDLPAGGIDAAALLADVRSRLDGATTAAGHDPFGAAVALADGDVTARMFGVTAMAAWYGRLTGDPTFDVLAQRQAGFVLGANPWGVSFVIGVGAAFPRCPHHPVANLAGRDAVLTGAVVAGPAAASKFDDLEPVEGMRACGSAASTMDTGDVRFLDDVRAWPSVEPAIDMTSSGLLAVTLLALR